MITDCHIHLVPPRLLTPQVLQLLNMNAAQYAEWEKFCNSPAEFLRHMDRIGVGRAVLVSTAASDPGGMPSGDINEFVARYARLCPERLIAGAAVHPAPGVDMRGELERCFRAGARMLKLHPPHEAIFANQYLNGLKEIEILYRMAQDEGVPVMIHTGTSMFPHARNRFGDPMAVDDVAVDYPKLKIIMAHGGRPLWCETAFFLVRRHRNVYLDMSSIPPRGLLRFFPRLEEIAAKTLFGTDFPSPGVPEMEPNLRAFSSLALSAGAKEEILTQTALRIWPQ